MIVSTLSSVETDGSFLTLSSGDLVLTSIGVCNCSCNSVGVCNCSCNSVGVVSKTLLDSGLVSLSASIDVSVSVLLAAVESSLEPGFSSTVSWSLVSFEFFLFINVTLYESKKSLALCVMWFFFNSREQKYLHILHM
uniref:Uncharacterized protein n=1 Tax=Cacopsylla melanoneura TaxID=428564 RepID=A0A8D8YX66_9HEMI